MYKWPLVNDLGQEQNARDIFAMPEPADHSRSLVAFAPALALLAICVLINYVDRGNLSVAAPLLQRELGLSPSQLGILFAAFFTTYTAMQFVIGWLIDRFDVNRILAAGFLVWSLATATTGLLRGFALLLVMRLILGVGESVAVPAASKILARHLSEHHRGFATGVVMAALRCGNAVGTLGAGFLMARFGWRPVFVGIGLVSLLWLPAWMKWMPRTGSFVADSGIPAPGFAEIFKQKSFWGTSVGQFCCNYLFYFMITWLPAYLVLERHLSMAAMARVAGLYYSVDAGSAIATGFLQDFCVRKGLTPTVVRKAAMALAFSISAVAVLGCAVASPQTYLYWLMAAGIGCGMTSPGIFTFCQTLAGPHAVGKWYGAQNGFSNLAGVVGPALTGFVVQATGNFVMPFAITSSLCVVGGLAWVFLVGRIEQINWALKTEASITPASVQA
jgi:MFS transporter, ACS family, D-galactonate transporter